MPIIDSNQPAFIHIDRYWQMVRRTLEEVFRQPNSNRVNDLEQDIKNSSSEEQVMFYHAEPLDIAADIIGRAPTDNEVSGYDQLVTRERWGAP
jgi:hypothetical protein